MIIIKSSPLCVFVCLCFENFSFKSFFFFKKKKKDVWLKKKRKTQKVNKTGFLEGAKKVPRGKGG